MMNKNKKTIKKMDKDYQIHTSNEGIDSYQARFELLYHGGVEYEYDGDYDCDNSCDDGGICRCYRIYSAQVKSFKVKDFVESIYIHLVNSRNKIDLADGQLLKYAIEKLANLNKFDLLDLYEVSYGGGYYGDEIENIKHLHQNSFINQLQTFMKLKTFNSKVNYLLTLEYGYLRKDLKDLNWHIEEVEISKIKTNEAYQQKVKEKIANNDSNSQKDKLTDNTLLVGKKINNFITLIDGYHRLTTLEMEKKQNNKAKKIKMLIAK